MTIGGETIPDTMMSVYQFRTADLPKVDDGKMNMEVFGTCDSDRMDMSYAEFKPFVVLMIRIV
jgi:hypothetical protein